ncbi:Vacuolar membrane protein [Beauveria bassiana]|uniref:CSI2 protein n=1 Tax=Beauveria bassiana (strain ARSEF 2860) TaxID=655819 RepID=J5JF88_BEAB2|nr:CSI2 protein [Beauveria bassiana ARSEF 2860]EJP64473.1 CSI2 protein [Beauveria bassiana ARSEF 2860]KAF1735032.1 Vacuolar membrane protein [Beauveria bassiana]KAH8710553.1 Vacuolar membrane protein [Beauveria bassiana]
MRLTTHIPGSATLLTAFALLNGIVVPVRAADEDSSSASASASSSASATPSSSSASASSASPSLTSSESSSASARQTSDTNTESGGLTGLPTLTNIAAIPTYPPPAVPDTKDAPFMQSSSAPEGTVFIAVGAILGAFFLAVLIWRAIVSLLLHRSVERASKAQHVANTKKKSAAAAAFPAPPAPFYKYTDQESTRSLGQSPRRANRRSTRGPDPSNNPSQSNLFFSPTAANSGAAGNRGSAYLPSGFYAGSAAASHQQSQSIGMANLNPASGQYANGSRNNLGGSPPESPMFHARRDASTSSINLAAPLQPGQRAPSAYLEDLLAEDPSAFPPQSMSGSRR